MKLLPKNGRTQRIRVPELLAAVKWAAARLNDAGDLLRGADALPLAAINGSTPEGAILAASARQILINLGKKDATAMTITVATIAAILATVSASESTAAR